jgi:hypothetical protein
MANYHHTRIDVQMLNAPGRVTLHNQPGLAEFFPV